MVAVMTMRDLVKLAAMVVTHGVCLDDSDDGNEATVQST